MSRAAASDLTVRQHERIECDVRAMVRVLPPHADIVRWSRRASPNGAMAARIVDVSRGGLGLRAPLYVPAGTRLGIVAESLARPGAAPPAELVVVVRRVAMHDRAPTYYIGTAFDAPSAEQEAAVAALLSTIHAASGAQGGPRA